MKIQKQSSLVSLAHEWTYIAAIINTAKWQIRSWCMVDARNIAHCSASISKLLGLSSITEIQSATELYLAWWSHGVPAADWLHRPSQASSWSREMCVHTTLIWAPITPYFTVLSCVNFEISHSMYIKFVIYYTCGVCMFTSSVRGSWYVCLHRLLAWENPQQALCQSLETYHAGGKSKLSRQLWALVENVK